jgi:carboxyl-terminal processing protease
MKRILWWVFGVFVVSGTALGISWIYYAPPQDTRGVWKTDGYGLVLDVSATTINVYQVSDIHCMHDQTIPAHTGIVNFLEGVSFAKEDGRLALNVSGTLNPIYADPIDAVPELCDVVFPADPTTVFDVIWEVMNTHYAHFGTHSVDWAARRSLRPLPGSSLDNESLLEVLKATLTGLDDGHTYIATGDTVWSPAQPHASWHDERHLVRDTTIAAVPDLSEPSETGLRVGWATPDIGYVYMTHMDPKAGLGQRANVVAAQSFAQVLPYFANAKGIILDVRYNPGGSDDVAMTYASFFTDHAVPVFTKTTRTETGTTAPFTATIAPQAMTTALPVVLLTSPYTGSATEVFTLAMRELPQVTTMGMPTSGGLSDIMSIKLPNGWELGFSHQTYLTMAGESFERIGIPPDVAVAVDIAAARAGSDNVLAQAIQFLSD